MVTASDRLAAQFGEDNPFTHLSSGTTPRLVTDESAPLPVIRGAELDLPIPAGFTIEDISHFMQLHECAESETYTSSQLATLYGAHPVDSGARFLTFAPNARQVNVALLRDDGTIEREIPMERTFYGNWSVVAADIPDGTRYAFNVDAEHRHPRAPDGETYRNGFYLKADPFAIERVHHRSVAAVYRPYRTQFDWGREHETLIRTLRAQQKEETRHLHIFQMQPGSFDRDGLTKEEDDAPLVEPSDDESRYGRYLNWRELAPKVIAHCHETGFNAIQMNGFFEYPNHKSMGYQVSGYFCPSSRFGMLEDCKAFIKALHEAGIVVYLDFIPHHMAIDSGDLHNFDGSALFEDHYHEQWGAFTFDLTKKAVRDFLVSSARYMVEELKIDGFRVDAASDIHTERPKGWIFLQELNRALHETDPNILTIAEYPKPNREVTVPLDRIIEGGARGLGFDYVWAMGLQHQLLKELAPKHAKDRDMWQLGARIHEWFDRRYIATFSHDDCGNGEGSLVAKLRIHHRELDEDHLPRGRSQARNILALNLLLPGPTSTFMGAEIGQSSEWRKYLRVGYETRIGHGKEDWEEMKAFHFYKDCTALVHTHPTLMARGSKDNLKIAAIDNDANRIALLRIREGSKPILIVQSWDPGYDHADLRDHRVTIEINRETLAILPRITRIRELLNSDDIKYGGRGITNLRGRGVQILSGGKIEFSLSHMGTSILELEEEALSPPLERDGGGAASGGGSADGAQSKFDFLDKMDETVFSWEQKKQLILELKTHKSVFTDLLKAAKERPSEMKRFAKAMPESFKAFCRQYVSQTQPVLGGASLSDEAIFEDLSFLTRDGHRNQLTGRFETILDQIAPLLR